MFSGEICYAAGILAGLLKGLIVYRVAQAAITKYSWFTIA